MNVAIVRIVRQEDIGRPVKYRVDEIGDVLKGFRRHGHAWFEVEKR